MISEVPKEAKVISCTSLFSLVSYTPPPTPLTLALTSLIRKTTKTPNIITFELSYTFKPWFDKLSSQIIYPSLRGNAVKPVQGYFSVPTG